ncbi:MAG: alpha/beta hydrolase [Bacteroidales bacterium]|nr:MAG: alpha/beta hydrolase [Bacteroidales bacterium]
MKGFDHISGKYLVVDNAKIYYEEYGVEDKPALLVLHGGFGNIQNFNDVIPSLREEFRVIGIDSRGQGKSSLGSNELTYELLQQDVERVLEHLRISDINILGFSDGGVVALKLASNTRLNVKKLIAIGSRWHTKNIQPLKDIFSKITGEILKERYPSNYDIYQRLNPEPNVNLLAEKLIRLWLDEGETGYPNEKVRNISCPVLIMRGENDPIVSNRVLIELSEMLKTFRLINIPNAGHVVFKDQKEQFLLSVKDFLKE